MISLWALALCGFTSILSPNFAIAQSTSATFGTEILSQSPNIRSLQLTTTSTTPLSTTSIVTSDSYYGEINFAGIDAGATKMNNPKPINQFRTKPNWDTWTESDHQVSLQVEYTNYHPSDQVLTCLHLSNLATDQNSEKNSQHIKIPSSALPFFMACCPTVYTPTIDPEFLVTVDLTLDYPFTGPNTNLNKVGCGHSQTIVSTGATTGDQSDPYPRKIDKFGYRNTPNPWYYNQGQSHFLDSIPQSSLTPNPSVLTYSEFKLPTRVKPLKVVYEKQQDQHQNSNQLGQSLFPVQCKTRSISHSGEGYHRLVSYSFNPNTCYADGIDNLQSNPQNDEEKHNGQNPNKIPLSDVATSQCSYLALTHLPNSVFVDPYQISYAGLALHRQEERELELGEGTTRTAERPDHDPIIVTKSTKTDWFLYDFIDVEAQMNNAVGNNLVIKFPSSQEGKPIQIDFPVHLRYSPSRFGIIQDDDDATATATAQPDDIVHEIGNFFDQFLSTNVANADEFRATTFLNEPHLFLFCPTSTSTSTSTTQASPAVSTQHTILPSIRQLFKLRQEQNLKMDYENENLNNNLVPNLHNNHPTNPRFLSLPPITLTAPVGSLNLYPLTMIVSFTVLILSAVLFHFVIIGKWFEHFQPDPPSCAQKLD